MTSGKILGCLGTCAFVLLFLEVLFASGLGLSGAAGSVGDFVGGRYWGVCWSGRGVQVHGAHGLGSDDRESLYPWLRSLDIDERDPLSVDIPYTLKLYRYEPVGLVMCGVSWPLICAMTLLAGMVCRMLASAFGTRAAPATATQSAASQGSASE